MADVEREMNLLIVAKCTKVGDSEILRKFRDKVESELQLQFPNVTDVVVTEILEKPETISAPALSLSQSVVAGNLDRKLAELESAINELTKQIDWVHKYLGLK